MSNEVLEQVPKGYKQSEVGVIPEEWSATKLGKFCGFTQGVQVPQSEQLRNVKNGFIRYLYIRDFFTNDFPWYIEDIHPNKIMQNTDIMMVNTGNTAGAVYSGAYGVLSNNAFKISFDKKIIDRSYLFSLLRSCLVQDSIKELSNSSGQPHVGHKNVAQVIIPIPPRLKEQIAIASALSDVDALITSVEKLIAKKRAIKTAAMQQLLTGKKRLPPFDQTNTGYKQTELGEIPEDWKIKNYGQIFKFLTTASNSRSDLHENGDCQYIHYGDIHVKWDSVIDMSSEKIPKINRDKVKNATILMNGDLVMADASEDYNGIGKSAEIINLSTASVSGLHTFLLRDTGVFVDGYRGYLHKIKSTKQSFDRLATGLKVFGLSKGNLKDVLLAIPPKEEQRAIVKILSEMTNDLSVLDKRLNKTKELKQGMMQELLTGRTRLV